MKNIDFVIERIQKRLDKLDTKSPQMKEAFTLIGLIVASQTKINIRTQGIIDTGTLLNSIRYELIPDGVMVGSFGVKYAAINEFGGVFTDKMRRAMFAALRERGGKQRLESRGVIKNDKWKARPYLRPAVKKQTNAIVDILRRASFGNTK